MKLHFHGHEFLLHHSGALYWQDQALLVASDLHLEKGSHHARRGFFLPPYDTRETLKGLVSVCALTGCKTLILLGDCFHDEQGHSRMTEQDLNLFDGLRRYSPIWIHGNHDGDFVPAGFQAAEAHSLRGITFRHQAIPGAGAEISGHFHPKADISPAGRPILQRCFVVGNEKMILPAFGAYTGGMNASEPAVKSLVGEKARYYILGRNKVYLSALEK